MKEDKFYSLDILNIEIQRIGKKQRDEGLDALDIKVLELVHNQKIDIITKIKPENMEEQKRLSKEASDFLVQTLLEDMGVIDVKLIDAPVNGGVKKSKSRAKKG